MSDSDSYGFKEDILQAIEYFMLEKYYTFTFTNYRANLQIAEEIDDRRSAGMTYGNLGNCHYLLKNFENAIDFHRKVCGKQQIN